jgi:DNA-binding transcriptional regulator YiaG
MGLELDQSNSGDLRMPRNSVHNAPEWSRKILAFRQARKLTQGELGKQINTSAMAVSLWERRETEPSAEAYSLAI